MKFSISLAFAIMLSTAMAADREQSQQHTYQVTTLASGLVQPWSMVFLPDNNILIAEKRGTLRILDVTGELSTPMELESIHMIGQGGLMDLTLHPNFDDNGFIYYSYTYKQGNSYGTAIGRLRMDKQTVVSQQTIYTADNLGSGSRHFGSRIAFDNQGYLYLCLGDRGEREQAQDLTNHKGTILRLKDDGTIPADNPFANMPGTTPAIYSYGHRNLQGCEFFANRLWTHEHGPRGGDEINIITKGANYGWPTITYGRAYSGFKIGEGTHKDGMEQPLVYWVPSIAPSGLMIYQGNKFQQWKHNLFVGALAGQHLRRVVVERGQVVEQETLLKGRGRIREVAQDREGYIYILTDAADSELLRLEPVQ